MSNFELVIWDDECDKVTFYTVKEEGAALTETDKFFDKYSRMTKFEGAAQQLLGFIRDSIGEDHGAIDDFFNRVEDEVTGLPPHGRVALETVDFHFPKFPLRLYALRVNNRADLVVLFNGGIKSARTIHESGDLSMKFLEAKAYARKIEQSLRGGSIEIDLANRKLISFDGSNEIVL